MIHLCVVPRPGAELDLTGLRNWARTRLDRFKLPDHLHLRAELPLGPTGKADRRALRRMIERLDATQAVTVVRNPG